MDIGPGILAFGTLGFVAAFAFISARVTERRRLEATHPKSSLAADAPRRAGRA